MGSRTSAALLACLTGAALLLSGCQAPKVLDAVWPRATSERSIAKPPGPAKWPLTGLDAPSADATRIRVVSVKIENAPQARPQSGLDQADVVYETVTEGGITRFNALFQSKSPKQAGPVRSARASDFYILPQYHALFAHVSAESNLLLALKDRKKYDDMDQAFNPIAYRRSTDRPAPHNMYVDVGRLRSDAITRRKYAASVEIRGLAFSRGLVETTETISSLTVPFAANNKVSWRFDAGSGTYLRSINGKAHVDAVSHAQYSAHNVVVLWAQVRTRSHKDVAGSKTLDIVLVGSGRATVFRNGVRYDGVWQAGFDGPPTLRALDGTTLRLAPGNTWFEVIGNDQNIAMR